MTHDCHNSGHPSHYVSLRPGIEPRLNGIPGEHVTPPSPGGGIPNSPDMTVRLEQQKPDRHRTGERTTKDGERCTRGEAEFVTQQTSCCFTSLLTAKVISGQVPSM